MDFTGDGIADILSGCYWSDDPDCPEGNAQAGYIYVLAGNEDGSFSEAKPVLTAEEKPLTNVPLSRERLENYDTDNIEFANICTAQFAADYDGDGDLDLVVGEFGSKFYLHLNSAKSSASAPVFADKPKLLDVKLPDQHSGPHLVDWDGDGDLDLLSGSSSGSIYLSTNEGSATKPKWADFECLIKGDGGWSQSVDDDTELKPCHGVRVCVTDFNRDGKLDLIAGDATTIERKVPGLSAEKAARLKKEYEAEMQPIQAEMQKIYEKYEKEMKEIQGTGNDDAAAELREKVEEETEELSEKMMALQEKEKLFSNSRMTGHVWVYLQK